MQDNGKIDATLNSASLKEIIDLIQQIENKMPFLLMLSNAEKKRLAKPRVGTKQVAESVVEIQSEAGWAPAADDPMLADLSVYLGLTKVADRLSELQQKIDDTRLQAGSEAWKESLIRYGMLRQMARTRPTLTAKLDRIQPLIATRARRADKDQPEQPASSPASPASPSGPSADAADQT